MTENASLACADVITPHATTHKNVEVEERITHDVVEGRHRYRVVLIRLPVTAAEIDGKSNPFFHAEFKSEGTQYERLRRLEQAARQKVFTEFAKYWELT